MSRMNNRKVVGSAHTQYTWFEFYQKNKPQSSAVATGLILALVSGCHIGWGIFNNVQEISDSRLASVFTINAFYIGSNIGAAITKLWVKNGDKRKIYGTAAILYVLSCIAFVCNAKEFYYLLISRLLGGLAHSLTHITVIIHTSEVLVQELRGTIMTGLNFLTKLSVFTSYLLVNVVQEDKLNVAPVQILFGIGIIYAVLGSIFIFVLFYESPYLMIKQGRNNEALTTMIKLRNESAETMDIRNDFEEIQTMIEEDDRLTAGIAKDGNLRPLILVIASAVINVLLFNYTLNKARMSVTLQPLQELQTSPMVLFILHCSLGIITMIVFDRFRRRTFQINFGLVAGVVLILSGILEISLSNSAVTQIVLFCIFEIICMLGLSAMSDVLSSEAFPLSKKINSIAFKILIENILQIILFSATYGIVITEAYTVAVLITSGVIVIGITGFLYKRLPETRGLSLRQARDEFRN